MPSHVYPTQESSTFVTANHMRGSTSPACGTSGMTSIGTAVCCVDYRKSTATGYRTPGWQRIRNSGAILPFTAWDKTTLEARVTQASREYCLGSRRYRWDNFYVSAYDGGSANNLTAAYFTAKMDPIDLQYFVQKAAAQIYTGGWDAATFLAEITQLRRMLTGINKSLERLADLFDPRRGSSLERVKSAASLYLQGRYGWRTLMYDIQDLADALSQVNERRTRYRHATGQTYSGSYTWDNEVTSSNLTHRDEIHISWTVNARGTVISDIDVPAFQVNPVTTAWEVTKLSFVLDWLLNVGQALEASSFLLASKSYAAGGGYKAEFQLTGNRTHLGTEFGTIAYSNEGSWSANCTAIKRVPLSVSALPRMKLRLDDWKIIDLLALSVQRLL